MLCLAQPMVRPLAHVRASSRGAWLTEQAWRPRPCGYAHRRSGSPWVPVRSYYEGLPSMAGRGPDEGPAKAGPDQRGVNAPVSGPGRRSRGRRRHKWSAGRRRARKARGRLLRGARPRRSAISALRSLTPVREGRGGRSQKRVHARLRRAMAHQTTGAMNHVCFLL